LLRNKAFARNVDRDYASVFCIFPGGLYQILLWRNWIQAYAGEEDLLDRKSLRKQ
jgi:hypothetical protein